MGRDSNEYMVSFWIDENVLALNSDDEEFPSWGSGNKSDKEP